MAAPTNMDTEHTLSDCGDTGPSNIDFVTTAQKEKLKDYDLFTRSPDETRQVALHLHKTGCCVRCILRLLGEDSCDSFRASNEDIEKVLLPESLWTSSCDTNTSPPCPACLGVLQKYADKEFFVKIVDFIKKESYQFDNHQFSLILPVSLIVRQKAMFIHLKRTFGDIYSANKESQISAVKDVWKWTCGPPTALMLQSKFQNKASLDIVLTFNYADSDKECAFLLDVYPDIFKKRKQKKFGFETFNRTNVEKTLSGLTNSKFEDNSKCPPPLPAVECVCDIEACHEAIFIAGRYMKYSRTLSQSPWWLEDKRIMENSVEELITGPLLEAFKPADHKLSSSGREDVDVRMLGLGRPFVIELLNPHASTFTAEDIALLQKKINTSTKDIQVRDLQIVTREETDKLKEGEEGKVKSYSAFCWCERELTEADMELLSGMKELSLSQRTPLRVLHRRTAAVRQRLVHSMQAHRLNKNTFKLNLATQAGTYIKEFVHGDFGRTTPSLADLLHADCDITALDVESVELDWPPFIDPINKDQVLTAAGQTSGSHESPEDAGSNGAKEDTGSRGCDGNIPVELSNGENDLTNEIT